MKRSKPIKRKTPLKRSTKPLKRSGIKRKAGGKKKSSVKAKKSKLQRDRENPRSRLWRNKADKLWGELIRWPGKCIIDNGECKGPLNAHHLITRSVGVLRHQLPNGVCLCSKHHTFDPRLSPHRGPVGFAAWMANRHPDQWDWAMGHRWDEGVPNYKEAYEKLLAIKEAM